MEEAKANMLSHEKNAGMFEGWHLNKNVSIAQIVAMFSIFLGLAYGQWVEHERLTVYKHDLDSYIKLDAAEMSHQQDQLSDIKNAQAGSINMMNAQYKEILVRLASIDASINRHLENHGNNK